MIRYYIPSDGDDPQHPNIFHMPSNISQPKLRDLRQHFPLPGSYHFRLKKKLDEKRAVWLDLSEDNAELPTCDGVILAKVTRISMEVAKPTAAGDHTPTNNSSSTGRTSDDNDDLLNMGNVSSALPPAASSSSRPPQSSPTSRPPTKTATPPPPKPPLHHQPPDSDPFGLFSDSNNASSATATASNSTPTRPSPPPQQRAPDLLNFDAFGNLNNNNNNNAKNNNTMKGGQAPTQRYPPSSQW